MYFSFFFLVPCCRCVVLWWSFAYFWHLLYEKRLVMRGHFAEQIIATVWAHFCTSADWHCQQLLVIEIRRRSVSTHFFVVLSVVPLALCFCYDEYFAYFWHLLYEKGLFPFTEQISNSLSSTLFLLIFSEMTWPDVPWWRMRNSSSLIDHVCAVMRSCLILTPLVWEGICPFHEQI